ncbi:MAG: hypothetical protein APF82_04425 [Sphingomonadales bacterium BRH_c42]|nr:MAG: hypothetical protein APF82_04425 [Sphingomonadales bacterium BRH_c42]
MLEMIRQCAHLQRMPKRKPAPGPTREFVKPAHWTNEPVPRPKTVEQGGDDPDGLSPTRYGDWEKNGIAIDF